MQDDLNAARIHTYLAQAEELSVTRNKESMNSLFRGFFFSGNPCLWIARKPTFCFLGALAARRVVWSKGTYDH